MDNKDLINWLNKLVALDEPKKIYAESRKKHEK